MRGAGSAVRRRGGLRRGRGRGRGCVRAARVRTRGEVRAGGHLPIHPPHPALHTRWGTDSTGKSQYFEEALTRTSSFLKATSNAFTFKNLFRQYAKWVSRHEIWAALRIFKYPLVINFTDEHPNL